MRLPEWGLTFQSYSGVRIVLVEARCKSGQTGVGPFQRELVLRSKVFGTCFLKNDKADWGHHDIQFFFLRLILFVAS